MQPNLDAFLAGHTARADLTTDWGGRFAFHVTAYLTGETPPLEYVTSVRAVVFQDDTMLCASDAEGVHLFPGGRREAGETLEETLGREVLEEAGCRLMGLSRLGFLLFHHLNPAPPDYRYPYPDFLQLIYTADAAEATESPSTVESDATQYAFRPIAEIQALELSPSQRLYLEAALRARGGASPSRQAAGGCCSAGRPEAE